MKRISHVIFDFGGTLLNLDPVLDVLRECAEYYGKQLSNEVINYGKEMKSISDWINKFFDAIGLNEEIMRSEWNERLYKQILAKEYKLIAGVDRLVQHLYRNNIWMAIATNGRKSELELVNRKLNNYFGKYFTHYVCGADDPDVLVNKPNPQIYWVCAKRFKIQPKSLENILIIEDSLVGITGAVASGMKTLLINDQKVTKFDTIANRITCIADCFDNFKPESIGIPSYK